MRTYKLGLSCVFLGLAGVSIANAAGLPGTTSQDVVAFQSAATSPAPAVFAWDPFDSAVTGPLTAANPNPPGRAWTTSGSTWQESGGTARATTSSTLGSATIQTGVLDATVEVTLSNLVNGANAGANLNEDIPRNLMVLYSQTATNSYVRVWRANGGGTTAVSGLIPVYSGVLPTSVKLRAQSIGPIINVWVDGTQYMNYTLTGTALNVKTGGAGAPNTNFGLWARSDTTTRFDDFHIDLP
jgi:hypothetical protein